MIINPHSNPSSTSWAPTLTPNCTQVVVHKHSGPSNSGQLPTSTIIADECLQSPGDGTFANVSRDECSYEREENKACTIMFLKCSPLFSCKTTRALPRHLLRTLAVTLFVLAKGQDAVTLGVVLLSHRVNIVRYGTEVRPQDCCGWNNSQEAGNLVYVKLRNCKSVGN